MKKCPRCSKLSLVKEEYVSSCHSCSYIEDASGCTFNVDKFQIKIFPLFKCSYIVVVEENNRIVVDVKVNKILPLQITKNTIEKLLLLI